MRRSVVVGQAGERAKRRADAAGARVRAWLGERVRDALTERRLPALGEELASTRARLAFVERSLELALARLDDSPLTGATTVHAAHARHPAVQAVFARHGLPRCPDCAVGADETLAEAAFGEGLQFDALLTELNAALTRPR